MRSKLEAAHPLGRRQTMPEPDGETRNVSACIPGTHDLTERRRREALSVRPTVLCAV